jgi:hypothetical protein
MLLGAGKAGGVDLPVTEVQFPQQPVVFLPSDAEWACLGYSEQSQAVMRLEDAHLRVAVRGVKNTDHQAFRTVEFLLEGRLGRYRLWVQDLESGVYRDTVALPCDRTVNVSLLIAPGEMKQLKGRLPLNEPEPFRLLVNSKVGADAAELGEVQIINFDRLSEDAAEKALDEEQGRSGNE